MGKSLQALMIELSISSTECRWVILNSKDTIPQVTKADNATIRL